MSSTSNVQDLLVNVFRPTYKYEAGTGFVPSLTISNVSEIIATRVQTATLNVSDSNGNTYIGCNAGNGASNTASNVAIGYQTMGGALNSSNNVALGFFSLDGLSNSDSNVAIGARTDINGRGLKNILIGPNVTMGDGSFNILIGSDISAGNGNYRFQLGSLLYGDLSSNRVGILTSSPRAPVDISGLTFFRDKVGIQTSNPIYSLDVNGTAYATTFLALGAGAPTGTYSFSNSPTVGMYLEDISTLGFASSGKRCMTVNTQKTIIYGNLDVCGTLSAASGGGGGGGSGTIASNGSAGAPSFTFSNDLSTGLHLVGGSVLGFDTSGRQRMTLSNGFLGIGTATPRVALDVSGDISANVYNGPGGTEGAPHYTFSDDRTTGLFFPGANIVGFTAGGTERMRISNANIGIGTTAPTNALDVSGTLRVIGPNGNITFSNGTVDISGTQVFSSTGALRNAYSTSNSLGGIAMSSGVLRQDVSDGFLVAVGQDANSIATSPDGITWTARTSPFGTISAGYAVAWNGSLWVAVGQGTNTVATSPDGITWTGRGSPFIVAGIGIAWNGSLWVAVGQVGNTIATSPDGITWTGRSSPFTSSGNGIAWNGSLWVAVGEGTNTIATSPDGITWTARTSPFSVAGRAVAWNGSLWVAVGSGTNTIATSPDGITWTARTNPIDVTAYAVAWNGSLWIAVGSGTNIIATSPDGITWTGQTSPISSIAFGITWNGSLWVAVGYGTNTIATSPDGITWTGRSSPFNSSGNGVASRAYVLPVVRNIPFDVSDGTFGVSKAIITANVASSNRIGGVTLSNYDICMSATGIIRAPIIRNALTPSTYDISGGNISNSGLTQSSNFRASNGTVAVPSYSFASDPSTGLHLVRTSYLAFDTSGVQRMCISGNSVGIGTGTPAYPLDICASAGSPTINVTTWPRIPLTNALMVKGVPSSARVGNTLNFNTTSQSINSTLATWVASNATSGSSLFINKAGIWSIMLVGSTGDGTQLWMDISTNNHSNITQYTNGNPVLAIAYTPGVGSSNNTTCSFIGYVPSNVFVKPRINGTLGADGDIVWRFNALFHAETDTQTTWPF